MNLAQRMAILLIRGYQMVISPALAVFHGPAGRCRFSPTCSQYAHESIRTHGMLTGAALAARRLCRCNPWGPYGHDPVPALKSPLDLNLNPDLNLGLGARRSGVRLRLRERQNTQNP